jgi:hypothetical protein
MLRVKHNILLPESNGIEQDKKVQGSEYLERTALNDHSSAKIMCNTNNINY